MREAGSAWLLPQWACQGCQGLSFPSCSAGGWLFLCRRQPPDNPLHLSLTGRISRTAALIATNRTISAGSQIS